MVVSRLTAAMNWQLVLIVGAEGKSPSVVSSKNAELQQRGKIFIVRL
jgi:hypothetical protein